MTAVAACVSLTVGGAATAKPTPPVLDMPAPIDQLIGDAPQTEGADTVEAEFIEFGRFKILGNFGPVIAGSQVNEFVTVDETVGRLASIRVDTGEIRYGDEIGTSISYFVTSDTGDDVYAVSIGTQLGGFWLNVYLVDLDTLTVEASILADLESDEPADGATLTPVPGTDQFVVLHEPDSYLLEAGQKLPDTIGSVQAESARVYPGGHGYFHDMYSAATYAFDVTPTGVTNLREIFPTFGSAQRRGFVDEGIVRDNTLYSVPDLTPTPYAPEPPATFRLVDDPWLDVRYRVDVDGVAIVDGAGDVLTEGVCRSLPRGTSIGNGLFAAADRDGSIIVTDALDRCGAYGDFTPVQPARVFDTRTGQGRNGNTTRIQGGSTTRVQIHGLGGVPADGVESVALNVTAVRQRDARNGRNFLTVWPAGFDQPTVANINLSNGEIVGNMVTVSTSAGGFVDLYSDSGSVDVTVDVMGYFRSALTAPAARFESLSGRLIDTREDGQRLGPERVLTVDPRRVRPDATAIVVNVTAVQPDLGGHFRIYPSGAPLPDASSMNFSPGSNTNRLVTVPVDNGAFEIFNAIGSTHVTVDLVGVYRPGEPPARFNDAAQTGRFLGVVPFRLLDTRDQSPFDGDGRIPSDFFVTQGGFDPGLVLAGNVAAVSPIESGYLSAGEWRAERDRPGAHLPSSSSLNYAAGATIGNQTVIPTGDAGTIGLYASGTTHVVIDIFGLYTP